MSVAQPTFRALSDRRGRVARRRRLTMLALVVVIVLGFMLTLVVGQSVTPPGEVIAALLGEPGGARFVVAQLRLPRATLSILAGFSFGIAGAAFQTMLRNPLASPDIIGISSGASAAAVFAIVVLGLDGGAVSAFAIVCGLGVALLIFALAYKGGVAGTRLILVGIGISAMLESLISYVLSRASDWDLQEALRWLAGSVNGVSLAQGWPMLVALALFGSALLAQTRNLETLRLGDDAAAGLGVRVTATRIVVVIAAVGLIAFATAATGPIAFVAFLAGPIAQRLAGSEGSVLVPAGLVGAALVLVADYVGQFALPGRYPVGVVTGALGAPYLICLIVSANRAGEGG